MYNMILLCMAVILCATTVTAQQNFDADTVKTSKGELTMTFIGHGTLMFSFNGKTLHLDPWSRLADYTKLPKADIILVTHEHGDHLDGLLNAEDRAEPGEPAGHNRIRPEAERGDRCDHRNHEAVDDRPPKLGDVEQHPRGTRIEVLRMKGKTSPEPGLHLRVTAKPTAPPRKM